MPTDREHEVTPFAGELFQTLAAEGRLVLDAEVADRTLADLRRSLDTVKARLEAVRRWNEQPRRSASALRGARSEDLVDGVFIQQIAPGLLERAASELPKYIAAVRAARRPAEV